MVPQVFLRKQNRPKLFCPWFLMNVSFETARQTDTQVTSGFRSLGSFSSGMKK